jgi:GH15 family glucan-1,4-alpha-glucosidase
MRVAIYSLLLSAIFGPSCSQTGARESGPQELAPRDFSPRTSFFTLPTGNGHGFQVFDTRVGRMITLLDHPYRFLRRNADERKDGIERRNLLESLRAGFESESGPSWFEGPGLNAEYVDQSGILRVSDGKREAVFFSPYGLEANALVMLWRQRDRSGRAVASLSFHLGGHAVAREYWNPPNEVVRIPGGEAIRLAHEPRQHWVETGRGQGSMMYVPLQPGTSGSCEQASCSGENVVLQVHAPASQDGWSGMLIAYAEDPGEVGAALDRIHGWLGRTSGAGLLAETRAEWRRWRKPVPREIRFRNQAERKVWLQSEAVLRMSQVREPNLRGAGMLRVNHGMILASLAPGHWTTGWVRDGMYATVALARMGHFTEARSSLDFILNAEPVGKFKSYVDGYPYRVSVTRYYGNGEEEGDYSDQKTPNVETDGWGLYLWAARQYLESSGDVKWLEQSTRNGTVYQALLDGVARAIEGQLEPAGALEGIMKPDSSIWEVHQENARHFAYTTMAAARGLCDFAWIAGKAGDSRNAAHFERLAEKVRLAFLRSFTVPEGHLVAAVERSRETDLDTALAEAFGFEVIQDFSSPVAVKTFEHLQKMRLPTGGYYRVAGESTYQTNEWPFIDLRMAGVFLRMKRRAPAEALVQRLVQVAALNHHLLPELLIANRREGQIGDFQGSNPMVGYGAGAFHLALLERDGSTASTSCK